MKRGYYGVMHDINKRTLCVEKRPKGNVPKCSQSLFSLVRCLSFIFKSFNELVFFITGVARGKYILKLNICWYVCQRILDLEKMLAFI